MKLLISLYVQGASIAQLYIFPFFLYQFLENIINKALK